MELLIIAAVTLGLLPVMLLLSNALGRLGFRRARTGMQSALTAEERELFCAPAIIMMGRLVPASGVVMASSARLLWALPTWAPWWHRYQSIGLDKLDDIRSEKGRVTMRIEGKRKYIMPTRIWFGLPLTQSDLSERLAAALVEGVRT